ncbi:hypothetical protein ACUWC2_28870, partial [Klebsiella pneumoniae]|uniref:hypothetical protein n=1 Tax=Klebsiella pneumoniae TaxID=573 RepID=UPI004055434E
MVEKLGKDFDLLIGCDVLKRFEWKLSWGCRRWKLVADNQTRESDAVLSKEKYRMCGYVVKQGDVSELAEQFR